MSYVDNRAFFCFCFLCEKDMPGLMFMNCAKDHLVFTMFIMSLRLQEKSIKNA